MKHMSTTLILLLIALLSHGAHQNCDAKKIKKQTKKNIFQNTSQQSHSFVDLFRQLNALGQLKTYPEKNRAQKLKKTQQKAQNKLRQIYDTLAHIREEEASSLCAQLQKQFSAPNAALFDQLFTLTSFLQNNDPDYQQAIECMKVISAICKQGRAQCKKAQELLCCKALEKGIATIEMNKIQSEQSTQSLSSRIALLERNLLSMKKDTCTVVNCKEALFELAPYVFKMHNKLALQIKKHEQQLKTLMETQTHSTHSTSSSENEEFEIITTDEAELQIELP